MSGNVREVELGVDDEPRATGDVEVEVYDPDDFALLAGWDTYSSEQKLRAARMFEPVERSHYRNTIVRAFSESQARQFARGTASPIEATHLAVGTGNNDSAEYSDTALNNEVYRSNVTDSSAAGRQLELITFIDSTEANSADAIREVGVYSGDTDDPDATLLNHALIEPQSKSSQVAITITVTFTFKK